MRRVILIAAAGASLAGCSSASLDSWRPTPSPVQLQLESTPPGAEARTSLGQSCKTPCSLTLAAPPEDSFSVTYSLQKFEPATVQVQVTHSPGEFLSLSAPTVEPNPAVAELQPSPSKLARKMLKPKKPKAASAPAE
jgi:hypothetical protein